MAVEQAQLHPGIGSQLQRTHGVGRDKRPVTQAVPESANRRFDLARFDLSDMIECGRAVREVSESSTSMEAAAAAIVRLLAGSLLDAQSGERNCALVRCFKTHRLGQLPEELEAIARGVKTAAELDPQTPCLTLLATAGEREEWNDRRGSTGHAAIPLVSVEFVERAPMIAALLRQMGLSIGDAMYPDEQIILDAEQHAFNVFHVEEALGAASIPAQDFVRQAGVQSVLGFGGLLPSGDLFAIIMFSRVHIPRETADLFRTIALGVKLALLRFARGPVFDSEVTASRRAGRRPAKSLADEQIRSETATLKLLIPALEQAALYQTERLKAAVSDLRQQSEESRQLGMRLTAMLEATTDAVFLLDRDWRFTFLNSHAQAFMARDRDLLGTTVWEMFPEAVDKEFGRQFRRVMEAGVHAQFQEYYPAPVDKWFEAHAFPSEDGMAAFFRDISDRLKTEGKLRQTEKLAATGQMAASIAHEINNPLESMTNLLYLLASDETLSKQSRDWVQLAETELQRVAEITTHMLRFHRQSTSPGDVDLAEVLQSVEVLFRGRIAQAGVVVERRFRRSRNLRGFAGELRQVFANLVSNALDASLTDAPATNASEPAARGRPRRISLRVRDGRCPRTHVHGVRVTVADAGCGMNQETRRNLFEPFYTTKAITGTGLGLWVSRQLIEKHKGTVRVRSSESAKYHGTVFSVFFPGHDGAGEVGATATVQ